MCDHTAVTTAEYAREYEYILKSLFINDVSSLYYIMFAVSDYSYHVELYSDYVIVDYYST
jgi:hypothetical protein